jgi:hypothetical protein
MWKVIKGFGVDNMTAMIVNNLMSIGGLLKSNIARKLVFFGVDGSLCSKVLRSGSLNNCKKNMFLS